MKLTPGTVCVIKTGSVDVSPQNWGREVTLLDGPYDMHWWPTKDTSGPSHYCGPAWNAAGDGIAGLVLEKSLEPKRPPREPTVRWEDVPYFNPTQEYVTCP